MCGVSIVVCVCLAPVLTLVNSDLCRSCGAPEAAALPAGHRVV